MYKNKAWAFQFLRFCTVGFVNTTVDFTAFFFLNLVGVPYILAQMLAYSAGVVNSFLMNRKWTFRVKDRTNMDEVTRFIIVNGFSLLSSSGLLFIMCHAGHIGLWPSKIAATGISVIINFIGSRIWVFGKNQTMVVSYKRLVH